MLTRRYIEALDYARIAHGGQVRKGTHIPYTAHLIGVSGLVLDYGGDEDQAIAGLLHDVVEDCGEHHEACIRTAFGERVAKIVMACTDGSAESKSSATTVEERRRNWEARKRAYLSHLDLVEEDALLVSGCDKLHNLRAIVADLEDPSVGDAVYERFKGGRDGTLWYYGELVSHYARRGHPAMRELQQAYARMR